jgi:two-component system, cell cycle response regulator CpdR
LIRILLAERDEMMRAYLCRVLERAGYGVEAVADGAAAGLALEAARYDLLITATVLPGSDGVELGRGAAASQSDLRIMFIAGFAVVALQGREGSTGAAALSKPFHLRELVGEIDRMFQIGSVIDL